MTPVTSLLIRRARLVPIGPAAAPPQHPVDILVEDGLVTTVAAELDSRPGVDEVDADGRWCAPGLWDQHVHLAQWTLASQRLDLAPARSPEQVLALVAERVTTLPGVPIIGWGHRPGGVGARRHRLRARRGHRRHPGGADRRRRPPRLAQHHRADAPRACRSATRWSARTSGSRSTRGWSPWSATTAPRPTPTAAILDAAAARGVVGLVDFEFGGGRDDWVERWAAGLRRAADPLGDVRRHPRRRDRRGPAHRRPAARLRRPGDDGTAQDHQRRLAQHPHRLVLRALRATRTGSSTRPASPTSSGAELRDLLKRAHAGGLEVATHAIGDAAVAEALAAYAETGAIGLDRARADGRPGRRTTDGRARRPGQRPAGAPARRPRPDRAGVARPGGALLRVPLDARRRGRARARLRRAGLAPGPVAGDRGRGASQRRRPRALARRAGAHPRRGAGRLRGRPAHGRRRLARRPGPPRRRPAGEGRDLGGHRRRAAPACRWR